MYPVLSRMAIDIISVQATSVASKSAFSTSGRVLSIRRTRLTPASLEMCMCLKDHLDAQERKQHKSGLENPVDFEEEILDAEVQQNEAIPLFEEEIALDVASSEGTMSSSGSGGEEGKYEMEYNARVIECGGVTHWGLDSPTTWHQCLGHPGEEVCVHMHDHREPHFAPLKRFLSYVCGTLDLGLQLYASFTGSLVAYSDADWAGCRTTRCSTSGYCVFLGDNLLSWSSK
ncbi:zinc finger BED domain-containing protein RICESLEEPER 2 [Tanacetum coccineum]